MYGISCITVSHASAVLLAVNDPRAVSFVMANYINFFAGMIASLECARRIIVADSTPAWLRRLNESTGIAYHSGAQSRYNMC